MKKTIIALLFVAMTYSQAFADAWIRINQIGYLPSAIKVAVLMSEEQTNVRTFDVVDAFTDKTVLTSHKVKNTGALGTMKSTFRLDFSKLRTSGTYYICANGCKSTRFAINNNVYDGTADFVLNYMRRQRCGYNPHLRDSCHTKDAFIVYHPTKSGQQLDVRGGWHDATDCLQYTATSANAIYQMMLAYELNPAAFGDYFDKNGNAGANGVPDIVDEIAWGMDWLDRMNPCEGEIYNQIADDRDHIGMRLPNLDQADYGRGKGNGRPVYFCTGRPQQQGRNGKVNNSDGLANTAGKFAGAFALGSRLLKPFYPQLADRIGQKAAGAYRLGVEKPGVQQTASVLSPYIYAESNYADDMELGAIEMYRFTNDTAFLNAAATYGKQEPVTPWMGADTASHYQWYPFMNVGHYRIATLASDAKTRRAFTQYMRRGIDTVWHKAQNSPFMYGIPPVWCSNNLTTAMLTQCILYRHLTNDRHYEEMEAALRDWLLGCNPWGVSMIIELPEGGIFPTQPHALWERLKRGKSTGGLVDGPVYTSIFKNLLGVSLKNAITYERFQPGSMVYHDGTHDYSTNEPTMDGTASLTFPFSAYAEEGRQTAARTPDRCIRLNDGIVRGDPERKRIALVFTAAQWADGADTIISTLKSRKIRASFFFTGEFYEKYPQIIARLVKDKHYVGSHSYGHLLYSPWDNRDSMLVSHKEFDDDIMKSYKLMAKAGIPKESARYFIPPYEHYNKTVSAWAKQLGLQVINYTSGTRSNADYTTPDMKSYATSEELYTRLLNYEKSNTLNGYFLLLHFGTHPARTDKFYNLLPQIIDTMKQRGYEFVTADEMIEK